MMYARHKHTMIQVFTAATTCLLVLLPASYGQNEALNLDGSGDFVSVLHSASLDFTGDITVEAWFNMTNTSPGDHWLLIDKSHGFGDNTGWGFQGLPDGTLLWFFGDGTDFDSSVGSSADLADGVWHHVAGVVDGDEIRLYVDGVLDGSVTVSGGIAQNTRAVNIGASWGGGTFSRFFTGQIDDVRIWNVARTESDIVAAKDTELAGTETGLVAYWNFNDVSGGSVTDASANGNDGNTVGDAGTIASGAPVSAIATDVRSAVAINGNGSHIDFGAGFDPNNSDMTISFWLRTNQATRFDFDKRTGSANEDQFGIILSFNSAAEDEHHFRFGNEIVDWTYDINNGNWHHVTIVRDTLNSTLTVYVNGIEVATAAVTIGNIQNTAAFRAGIDSTGTIFYDGFVDDLQIWAVARTPAQIQASLFTELTGTESGLIGYWNFNEPEGTVAADITTNSNDADLNGTAAFVLSTAPVAPEADRDAGSHVELDGDRDWVLIGDDESLDITHTITVEALIRTKDRATQPAFHNYWIAAKWLSSSNAGTFIFYVTNSGLLSVRIANSDSGFVTDSLSSNALLSDDIWYHVAFTYDNGALKLFINGVEDASRQTAITNLTVNEFTTDDIFIGDFWNSAPGVEEHSYKGDIDEVRIWNTARSAADIQATMNARVLDAETTPALHLGFDGGNADDASGNNNDGLLAGNAAIATGTAPIFTSGADDTFPFKRAISLSVPTNTANVPVEIRLTPGTFDYAAAHVLGHDLRFRDVSGNELNYFIENWDATGTSVVWVLASDSGTTGFEMYYGNPLALSASDSAGVFTIFSKFPDFSGWSDMRTSVCGSLGMMGGFGLFGAGAATEKTFADLAAGTYRVTFNFYHIDSWDNEQGQLFWNDDLVWSRNVVVSGANICGAGFGDDGVLLPRASVLVSHDGGDATLRFTSNLNTNPTDESWGVNDIRVFPQTAGAAGGTAVALIGLQTDADAPLSPFIPASPTGLPYTIVISDATVDGRGIPADTIIAIRDGDVGVGISPAVNSGASLHVDGSGDFFQVANHDTLNPSTQLTVEAWVKTTDGGASKTIVAHTNGCASTGYLLWLNENSVGAGRPSLWIGAGPWLDADISIHDGEWHHVAGTYDGSTSRIYVDGVLRNSGARSGNLTSTSTLQIGGSTFCGGELNGNIDDVRIWNTALTAAEINARMNLALTGIETGLVGYWRFDGNGNGSSSNEHDGTFGGNANATGEVSPVVSRGRQITVWQGDTAHGLEGFTPGNAIAFSARMTWFGELLEFDVIPTFIQGDGTFGWPPFTVADLAITTGLAPAIATSATFLNFPATIINTASPLTFEISNTGNATLELTDVSSDNPTFGFTVDETLLEAGGSTSVTVTFTPTTVANHSGTITIQSDDPEFPEISVGLQGVGVPTVSPHLSTSPTQLQFGSVSAGGSRSLSFSIINTGSGELSVTGISSANAEFTVSGATSFSLFPNQVRSTSITFSPQTAGAFASTVTVTSNAGSVTIPVIGTAIGGHFGTPAATGRPYTIVVDDVDVNGFDLDPNGEVGVFDGETLVGVAGPAAHALVLDGSGDYMEVPDSASLDMDNAVTFETWLYVESITETFDAVVGKGGRNYTMWLHINGFIHFSYTNTGGSNITLDSPNGSISQQTWHHVACVLDAAAGIMNIYIDGQLAASRAPAGAPRPSASTFRIGNNLDGSTGNFLHGRIDDVRVWSAARTETEINEFMDKRAVFNHPDLAANWTFDDGAARDRTRNSNDGELFGNAALIRGGTSGGAINITAWEGLDLNSDDVFDVPGFTTGNPISFRLFTTIFDSVVELPAAAVFSVGDGTFGNGQFAVASLTADSGLEPDISIDTNRLFVGQVEINQTIQAGFTIANTGNSPLQVSVGDDSPVFSADVTETLIPATDDILVAVTFAPTTPGNFTGVLTVTSSDPDQPVITIALEGFALPAGVPGIRLSRDSLSFVPVESGQTATLEFHVINAGTAPLVINNIVSTSSAFTVEPTAFTLQNTNDNQAISVTFQPDATGFFGAALTVTSNGGSRTAFASGVGHDAHFTPVAPTGLPYHIIISQFELQDLLNVGDEIAVFDDDLVVGAAIVGANGAALDLDGNGDFIEAPDDASLDLAGEQFTLEAWVNITSFAGDARCILGKIGWSDSSNWSYNMHILDTGVLHSNFVNTAGTSFPLNSPNQVGTGWHHVAATYDGAVSRLYIDGVEATSLSASGSIRQNGHPVRIGAWWSPDTNYFNGLIDDVRIWNVARDAEDIAASMRAVSATTPGLMALWRFDLSLDDATAHRNTASLFGNATLGGPPPVFNDDFLQLSAWEANAAALPDINGFIAGNPMTFKVNTTINGFPVEWNATPTFLIGDGTFGDGAFTLVDLDPVTPDISVTPESFFVPIAEPNSTTRTLTITNDGDDELVFDVDVIAGSSLHLQGDIMDSSFTGNLTVWSVSGWIFDDGSKGGWRAIFQTDAGSDTALYIEPSNFLQFWPGAASTAVIPANTWVHVAVTNDGGTIRYYVNGVPAGTAGAVAGINKFQVGGFGSGDPERFFGFIDEVRFYDGVLSELEINEAMTSTLPGDTAGLVLYWNFDDGTATDLSGSGLHGILLGNSSIVATNAPISTWLTAMPTFGAIGPGNSLDVTVSIDTAGLFDAVYPGSIVVTNNTPNESPIVVPVTLNVTADAQISASPTSLDFDEVLVGQSADLTFTVTNIGADDMTITSLTPQGDVGFSLGGSESFPVVVAPLATHVFTVTFTPVTGAAVTDTLVITSDAINDPAFEIALSGTGLTPPDMDVQPTSFTATLEAGSFTNQAITVSNSGQAELEYVVVGMIPWVSLSQSSGTVATGEDEEITATVSAIGLIAGDYVETLIFRAVNPDDTENPFEEIPFTFNLTVTGQPEITVPDLVDFGVVDVGASGSIDVAIVNSGADELTLSALSSSSPVFTFTGQATATIPPDPANVLNIHTITVHFTPVDDNVANGILTISSDAANGAERQIVLTGSGSFPPDIQLNPTEFTEVLNSGDVVARTLTVTNQGTEQLDFEIQLSDPGRTALALDGSGDYVSVPNSSDLSVTEALTIETWLYLEEATNEFIAAKESTAEGPYRLWIDGNGDLTFRLNGTMEITAATKPQLQTWTHVAATFDGSAMRLYQNGDLDAEAVFTPFPVAVNTSNLRIGRSFSSQFLHGQLDEFRLWNVAKNQSQIQAEMDQSLRGNESGLVLYYRFDGSLAGSATDLTAFGHNGSFFGNPERVASQIPINDFLTVTPLMGSVGGNDALDVALTIDSTGLKSNLYQQTLQITSNDPDLPTVDVPVTMTVVGQGQITASASALTFSDTFIGVTNSLALTLTNDGSEPLSVFEWNFSSADFSVSDIIAEVAEFSSQTVNIFFSPTIDGAISGTLTILNNSANDTEFTIDLSGVGVQPPIISVDPTQFNVNLDAGASDTRQLTVDNNGGSPLSYTIISEAGGDGGNAVAFSSGFGVITSPVEFDQTLLTIESWVKPDDTTTEVGTTVFARVNQSGGILYAFRLWSGSTGQLAQSGYEIIVGSATSGPVPFAFVPEDWVHAALVVAPPVAQLFVNGSSVFVMIISDLDHSESGDFIVGSDGQNNPFFGELDELRIWNGTRSETDINTARNAILLGNEASLLGYFNVDLAAPGQTVIADLSPTGRSLTLQGNAIVSASDAPVTDATGTGVDWLSLSGNSGAIAPGAAADAITLGFDTGDLGFGTVFNRLFVSSNDVVNGFITVPVTLSINAPAISLSTQLLAFGNVRTDGFGERTLTVFNVGNRDLEITDHSVTGDGFSLDAPAAPITIAPAASAEIVVRFESAVAGTFGGTLALESNAGDRSATLTATAFVPLPEITLSATNVTIAVDENMSAAGTLSVANDGEADLIIASITSDLPWVSVAPDDANLGIAPAASQDFAVAADATGILPGNYTALLTITHNDTDENPVTITVDIAVGPDPELRLPNTTESVSIDFGQLLAKAFRIENIGAGSLGIDVTENVPWITDFVLTDVVGPGGFIDVAYTIDTTNLSGGVHTGVIQISSNDGDHTFTIQLSVLAPVVRLSTNTITRTLFEELTETRPIVINNDGLSLLTVNAIGLDTIPWLSVAQSGVSVVSGGAQTLTFTFDASGLAAGTMLSDTFQIMHNDPFRATETITASIDVIEGAKIVSVTLDSDIGYQPGETITATQIFSTPTSSQSVNVDTRIVDAASMEIALVTNNRVLNLGAGNTFDSTIVVPGETAPGTYRLETVIRDGVSNQIHDADEVAFAVGTPVLDVAPASFDFADTAVGGEATTDITIANTGDLALTFTATPPALPFTVSATSGTVEPGNDVAITVTFSPTVAGSFADDLIIASNAGNVTVPLTGLSSEAAIAVAPQFIVETLDFSNLRMVDVTITNTGSGELVYNLSVQTGQIEPDWITLSKSGGTLGAGSEDLVTVAFQTNDDPISYAADLIINTNDPQNPQITVPVALDTEKLSEVCE